MSEIHFDAGKSPGVIHPHLTREEGLAAMLATLIGKA